MKRITTFRTLGGSYLVIKLPFNKVFEVGLQNLRWYTYSEKKLRHFDLNLQLSFRGRDHAGLRFRIQAWRLFFEFNLTDCRHWDYDNDRWHSLSERDREET